MQIISLDICKFSAQTKSIIHYYHECWERMKHIITSELIKLQPGARKRRQTISLMQTDAALTKATSTVSSHMWLTQQVAEKEISKPSRTSFSVTPAPPQSSSIFLFLWTRVSCCHLSPRRNRYVLLHVVFGLKTTGSHTHTQINWEKSRQSTNQRGLCSTDRWIKYSEIRKNKNVGKLPETVAMQGVCVYNHNDDYVLWLVLLISCSPSLLSTASSRQSHSELENFPGPDAKV